MSDWAILRLDLEHPDKGEVVSILANAPLDWKKYMEDKAAQSGKYVVAGRYVVAKLLYNLEYYAPEEMEQQHKQAESDAEND